MQLKNVEIDNFYSNIRIKIELYFTDLLKGCKNVNNY